MKIIEWFNSLFCNKPKVYNFNLILVQSDERPSWHSKDGNVVVTTTYHVEIGNKKNKKNVNKRYNNRNNNIKDNNVTFEFPGMYTHEEEQFQKTSYVANIKDFYGDGKSIWVLRVVTTNDTDIPSGQSIIFADSKQAPNYINNLKLFTAIVKACEASDFATSFNPNESVEAPQDDTTTETAFQEADDNKVDISGKKRFEELQADAGAQTSDAVEVTEEQLHIGEEHQELNEIPNATEESYNTINNLDTTKVAQKEAIIEELSKFGVNMDKINMNLSVDQLLSILSQQIDELRQRAKINSENLAKQQEMAEKRQQELEKNAKERTEENLDWQNKINEANNKYTELVKNSNSSKVELQAQVDELKANVAELKIEKKNLVEEKDALAKEKDTIAKDNEELRASDVGKLRDEVTKLKGEKEDLSNENVTLTSELDNAKTEVKSCNTRIETLESDNSNLTKQLKDKTDTCKEYELTLEKANKDAKKKQKQIETLTNKKKQAEKDLKDAQNKLNKANSDLVEASGQISSLEGTIDSKNAEISGLEYKISSLLDQYDNLASSMFSDVKQLGALFNDAATALVDAVKNDFICECNVDAETDTVQSMCRKIRNGINDVATKIQAFNNPSAATTIELQSDYEALIAASIELPAFTNLARWWAYSRLAFVANANRDEGRTASIKAMDAAYSALARMLALAGYRYQIPALFVENLNEGDYDNVTGKAQLNLDYQYPNVRSHVEAIDRDDRNNTIIDIVELGYYKNNKLIKKTSVIV